MASGDPTDSKTDTFASLYRTQARAARKPRPAQTDLFAAAPAPAKSPTPKAPPPKPERHIYTVRSLVTEIRLQVERAHTADLWVEGEITNLRPAASGHVYFTLKDGEAQLPIVLFRRQAQLLRFRPTDGLSILVRGRISVYEPRGQLQLIAETLEPRGTGAFQLAFEQLKQRLAAEGLFDPARKRPLPAFPRTVGVITSLSGAVLRDIVSVVRRRHAALNLLIYPATMQGEASPASVIQALRYFNSDRCAHPVDLILIARGGGSLEDLSGFNDESLARAIAASRIPTVSAIGHETDFTIADLVADLRAPTPSAAAEIITSAQHRIADRVAALSSRLHRAMRFELLTARQRYQRLAADHVLARLRDAISRRSQRLDDLQARLAAASARRLQTNQKRLTALDARLRRQAPTVRLASAQRRLAAATQSLDHLQTTLLRRQAQRLDRASARLESLSPLAVLSRGYALVYLESPTGDLLLREAAAAQPGDRIRARLANGTLEAEVRKP